MPNPTNVESYSAPLRNLVELASGVVLREGRPVDSLQPPMERIVELADTRSCRKTRFLIYSYLKACDHTKDPFLIAQAKAFRANYVMRCKGHTLVLDVRGNDPISQAISKAVAQQRAAASGIDLSTDRPLSQEDIDSLFKQK